MTPHNVTPAAVNERIVYGACRPGYQSGDTSEIAVDDWIRNMQNEGIERVCCLLDGKLDRYDDLLGQYEQAFSENNVCHAPIPDYATVAERTLTETIFPFLQESLTKNSSVVVHCSAGMGRTGHVLVLWLAARRDYSLNNAIEAVRETGRRPLESASTADLRKLLQACEPGDEPKS